MCFYYYHFFREIEMYIYICWKNVLGKLSIYHTSCCCSMAMFVFAYIWTNESEITGIQQNLSMQLISCIDDLYNLIY